MDRHWITSVTHRPERSTACLSYRIIRQPGCCYQLCCVVSAALDTFLTPDKLIHNTSAWLGELYFMGTYSICVILRRAGRSDPGQRNSLSREETSCLGTNICLLFFPALPPVFSLRPSTTPYEIFLSTQSERKHLAPTLKWRTTERVKAQILKCFGDATSSLYNALDCFVADLLGSGRSEQGIPWPFLWQPFKQTTCLMPWHLINSRTERENPDFDCII